MSSRPAPLRLTGLFVASVVAGACGSQPLPAPTVDSITPAQFRADRPVTLTVQISGQLPFSVDYQATPHAQVGNTVRVFIGTVELGTFPIQPDGAVAVPLTTLLPPGTHDVRVELTDGRSGTLAQGFTVEPGVWPDSYVFDAIGTQQAGVPFSITLRAQGANATGFGGTVQLTSRRGTISPTTAGPFVSGEYTLEVTVLDAGGGMSITATDLAGGTGESNTFVLTP